MNQVSRRSFFAAVMGAAAASALPKAGRVDLPPTPRAPIFRPFTIWDSVTAVPGEVLDEQIFPPPFPKNFAIDSISMYAPSEVKVPDLAGAMRGSKLLLQENGLYLFDAPLYLMPIRLPVRVYFERPKELRIFVHSSGVPLANLEPVPLSIIFQGIVRY